MADHSHSQDPPTFWDRLQQQKLFDPVPNPGFTENMRQIDKALTQRMLDLALTPEKVRAMGLAEYEKIREYLTMAAPRPEGIRPWSEIDPDSAEEEERLALIEELKRQQREEGLL